MGSIPSVPVFRPAFPARIVGNTIQNNFGVGLGGGIGLFGAGNVLVLNNRISNNVALSEGGGIFIVNEADEVIVQNLITRNSAPDGAGIYILIPQSTTGVRLVNNTVSANGPGNAAVVADGFNQNDQIINNLIIAPAGQSALLCNPLYTDGPPIVEFNDAFTPQGNSYDGMCAGFSGINGNISVNPTFVGTSNFHLKDGSPAIDVDNNSAPDLPSTDFAGNPRIINRNGGPTAVVDMGAYEFVPVVLAPKILAFGLQAVGSTIIKAVKLTNAQDKVLNISSYTVPTGYSVSGCGSSVAAFTSCMFFCQPHFFQRLELTNTPLPVTGSVNIGTPTVNVGSLPAVQLSGTPAVSFTNTPNTPIYVDIDRPARHSFNATCATSNYDQTSGQASCTLFTIPAGAQVVVETVGCTAEVAAGQGPAQADLVVPNVPYGASPPSGASEYLFNLNQRFPFLYRNDLLLDLAHHLCRIVQHAQASTG